MNETAPQAPSLFSTWLPLASLALAAAAFSLAAPSALARCIRPSIPRSFAAALETGR